MERELNCELQCEHCKVWFRSPLQLGYPEAFFDLARETCTTGCPNCGSRCTYHKDRMRFSRKNLDGSISMVEGKYVVSI
jgi:hypothetical protein